MFMVWWQVFDSPLDEATLHPNKEGELLQQQASHPQASLPLVSDHMNAEEESPTTSVIALKNRTSSTLPSMVWLMSFPNSGTSYTMRMVSTASQRAVATNYGSEFTKAPNPNIPVYPGKKQGPFWKGDHPLPNNYIMTKTHCGGRCVRCSPRRYISTLSEFTRACTEGSGCFENSNINNTGSSPSSCKWKDTRYPAPPGNPQIAKTIHLIRNPFDNLVSRFHLAHKKRQKEMAEEYQEWSEQHPHNSTGFATWCLSLDKEYGSPFDPKKIPLGSLTCQGEWFKYVQWHTLALKTIEKSQLPSLTLYYEDYEAPKWNSTVQTILNFLELPMGGRNIREFQSHPSYEYYTNQQRREARALVRKMAPDSVWALLSRYFD